MPPGNRRDRTRAGWVGRPAARRPPHRAAWGGRRCPGRCVSGRRRRRPRRVSRRKRLQDLTHTFVRGLPGVRARGRSPSGRRSPTTPRTASTRSGGPSASTPARTWTRRATSSPVVACRPRSRRGSCSSRSSSSTSRRRRRTNPDATVDVDDLIRFERRHGRIPDGALVAMHSGWAEKVHDPHRVQGRGGVPELSLPGL